MGTLAGFSSNIRPELIFNSMTLNAIFKKRINVANGDKLRSILFLSDLAEIIKIFLTAKKIIPGFYNATSYTFSIGELGDKIAKIFGAKINLLPDSETYSFSADNEKIKLLGFKVTMTFEDQVKKFVSDVESNNYTQKT
jgi:nucleoside-diphosphate-sugar epimerase